MKITKNGSLYQPIVIEAEEAGTVIISGSEILEDDAWSETSQGSGIWTHLWNDNFGRHAFQLPSSVDLDTEVRYHRELIAIEGDLARPYPNLDRLQNSTLHTEADSFLSDNHGFYVDETNDLIYLRSTKNPNDSMIEVGKKDGLLDIYSHYIVLRGITFQHDASFENSYSSTISGEAVKIGGEHILVEECTARDNGSDGMVFTPGSDLVVRRSSYLNNGRAGIITRRGYANAYIKDITVSYNQWRNDLGHYTSPDLSGYGKVMFSNRIYIENSTISHHKNTGIWFDAQNMDITLNNCYFTQNNGALWFEINALNLGLINSSIYDNSVVGVRIDSESIYLKNNVMSQTHLDGAWGVVSTLYRDLRTEQMVPDVYLGKWLTLENNIIAIKSGDSKLMFFKDSTVTGATATSLNNTFYAPTESKRIYSGPLLFSEWQSAFGDTSSQLTNTYPFTNDNTATVGFQTTTMNTEESNRTIEIPIELSKAIDTEVTLTLSVNSQTAIEESDFRLRGSKTITFRPLERKKIITLLLNRDNIKEESENFSLTLSNVTNASLINETLLVTINANDETTIATKELSHNPYNRIEAESYNDNSGVYIITNIGFGRFRKNNWAMYQNVDFGTLSPVSVDVSIAVPDGIEGRTFEVRLDSPTGQAIATLTTVDTDTQTTSDERTWDEFKTLNATLSQSVTGKHNIYIVNTSDYQNAGVVNWFVFQK